MKSIEISLKCSAVRSNSLYVLCDSVPFVIEIDIIKKKIIRKIICPEEINPEGELFSGLYIERNRMALVPLCAKSLWIYDFTNDNWNEVNISNYINPDTNYKFNGGSLKLGTIYMFGYAYSGILAVNVETYEIHEVLSNDDATNGFKGISSVIVDDNIYIPRRKKNEIISIDAKTTSYKIIGLGMSDNIPNDGISYDGNYFYILKNSGNVLYRTNKEFSSIKELLFDDIYNSTQNYFEGIECFGNKILFFGAGNTKCGYIYDLENNADSYILNETISYAKILNNNEVIVLKKGLVEIWDKEIHSVCKIPAELNEEDVHECFKYIKSNGKVYKENEIFGLEELIALLK